MYFREDTTAGAITGCRKSQVFTKKKIVLPGANIKA